MYSLLCMELYLLTTIIFIINITIYLMTTIIFINNISMNLLTTIFKINILLKKLKYCTKIQIPQKKQIYKCKEIINTEDRMHRDRMRIKWALAPSFER